MAFRLSASGDVMLDSDGDVIIDDADCCGDCSHCDGTASNTPIAFIVEFDGLEDGTSCSDCADYNISYCLPADTTCQWTQESGIPTSCAYPSSPSAVGLRVRDSSGEKILEVTYVLGGSLPQRNEVTFEKNYSPDEPVCDELDDENIPLSDVSVMYLPNECDPGTVVSPKITCAVTAL
jgi:hypothetical protein